jgi:two-component system sensor histidine kinase UhpB
VRVLAGQLITAHEEERVKIANELHDDLSQRLAALAMNLSRLREQLSDLEGAPSGEVALLERQSADLAERARVLSHELHPAVLEHIGLSAALLSLCSDFSGTKVHLEIAPLSKALPPAVELCLYRVAQETLRNAARHSGAAHAFVHVRQTADATELTVRDSGQGFDVEQSRLKGGLGLTSLHERVRLIGGTLQIESTIGRGTEVRVSIPLADLDSAAVTRGHTRRRKA